MDPTLLVEAEQHILDLNYPKLERLVKKNRREISTAMEHLFTALVEFCSRLSTADYTGSEDEFHLVKFLTSSLEKALREVKRGLKEAKAPLEKLFLNCLMGTMMTFTGDYQGAQNILVTNIQVESLQEMLSIPGEEGPFLPSIFGIYASFSKAIALEMTGEIRGALQSYSDLMSFHRQCGRMPYLAKPAMVYIVGMSMYRYGLLCHTLAMDPRTVLDEAEGKVSLIDLRGRLLFDTAVALRLFLVFKPKYFGESIQAAALGRYMESLESRFRRHGYRQAFDPEQQYDGNSHISEGGALFVPESVAEDILFCTQLLESLQPRMVANKQQAQTGASSEHVRASLARLIRYGDAEGASRMITCQFLRYASDAATYGRFILASLASGKYEEAVRAGEIYVEIGGKETSIILMIAKACLLYPSKAKFAKDILMAALERNMEVEMNDVLQATLALTYLILGVRTTSFEECIEMATNAKELLETLIIKEEGGEASWHLYLSLSCCFLDDYKQAEEEIKRSLLLEEDQPLAWLLFAIIKGTQEDWETCISICDTFTENSTRTDLLISLIKSAALQFLGHYDEAAQPLAFLISTLTKPAGPVLETVTEISAESIQDGQLPRPVIIMEPAKFRAQFFSAMDRVATMTTTSSIVTIPPAQKLDLTMSAFKESFPKTAKLVCVEKLLGIEYYSESVIPSAEVMLRMHNQSLLNGEEGHLMALHLWCELGFLYVRQGRIDLAELAAHEAFLCSELDASVYALRGQICEKQGRFENTLSFFHLGLQMDPENIPCLLGSARCRIREGKDGLPVALVFSRRAIDLDPQNVHILSILADICRQLDLQEEATLYFNRALKISECEPLIPLSKFTFLLAASNFSHVT